MSDAIEQKIRDTDKTSVDKIINALEGMLRKNTQLFQYVVGLVFSGLAIRFGLNIDKVEFTSEFYAQLLVYIILLITYTFVYNTNMY